MSYYQFTCPKCGSHSFGTTLPQNIGKCCGTIGRSICEFNFTWSRDNESEYFEIVTQLGGQRINKSYDNRTDKYKKYIQENKEFAPTKEYIPAIRNSNFTKRYELSVEKLHEIIKETEQYKSLYKLNLKWRTYGKYHDKNIAIKSWIKVVEETTRNYCKSINVPKQAICPKELRKELIQYILNKVYSEPVNENSHNPTLCVTCQKNPKKPGGSTRCVECIRKTNPFTTMNDINNEKI
jgi:hypothetical protein